jgi:hypothetical protein
VAGRGKGGGREGNIRLGGRGVHLPAFRHSQARRCPCLPICPTQLPHPTAQLPTCSRCLYSAPHSTSTGRVKRKLSACAACTGGGRGGDSESSERRRGHAAAAARSTRLPPPASPPPRPALACHSRCPSRR